MAKLAIILVLLCSVLACKDSTQNSDKQKDMTRGSGPENGTTATDQQNYGAGNQVSSPSAQQNPSHTDNLTTPSPQTPNPQASTGERGAVAGQGEKPQDSTQNPSRKQSTARQSPK
jgi:hypothetical protein